MKLCFVGIGSIGTRHILNLVDYTRENGIKTEIDDIRSGNGKALDDRIAQFVSNVYSYSDIISEDYDAIFVTNSTSCHYSTIVKYSTKTRFMFVEKPVFDRTDVDMTRINKDTVIADLVDEKIEFLQSGKIVNLNESRNAYQKREIAHFFDIMSGKIKSDNTLEESLETLRIAKGEVI